MSSQYSSNISQDMIKPRHVAVIMDGNGRWASSRGLPRTAGHHQGVEAAKRTVKAAHALGIEYLTLFGFSSENWSRPSREVQELMRILRFYLRGETAELHKNNIRLRIIGDRVRLDDDIVELIENAEELTQKNDGMTLVIALNYGGRHDIIQAVAKTAREMVKQGMPQDEQTAADLFPQFMMTSDIPDPDLIIRTSGEQRLSNFLIWQCAYSELIFTETLWPDFKLEDFEKAICEYSRRDRRFGAMKSV